VIIRSAKELEVYRKAYDLSMEIFRASKSFPPEERFALTSQIRRSSRSVSMNLREAWAKRRYPPHFVSKLTDCDGENSETDTSLDLCSEIGKMLGSMIRNPTPFLQPGTKPIGEGLAPLDARPLTSDL
jgi:four helix bundle protein